MSSISSPSNVPVGENSTVSSEVPSENQVLEQDAYVDENVVNGVLREGGQEWRGPQRDTVLQDITENWNSLRRREGAPQPNAATSPGSSVPSVRNMR